ncbi:response regulator transcription factor [Rhodoblastus sp.]|uniref:response regulator transcription factor n=1 Tax=Rhodoblastus sp. TaxID=1962975 RepID=UPI003F981EA5
MSIVHIVEDDKLLRESFAIVLGSEGFNVIAYSSSDDLIKNITRIESNKDCCIVADLHMTGTSGIELLRVLKNNGISLPVIIWTGDSGMEPVASAFENGAFDYHIKPCAVDILVSSVRAALKHQENPFVESLEIKFLRSKQASLSPEEQRVLERLLTGDSNDAIAAELGIETQRVLQHNASTMKKMGATHLHDLVRKSFIANRVTIQPSNCRPNPAHLSQKTPETGHSAFRTL